MIKKLCYIIAILGIFCSLNVLYLTMRLIKMESTKQFKISEFGKKCFQKADLITEEKVFGNKSVIEKASLEINEHKTTVIIPDNKSVLGKASLDTQEHVNEVKTQDNRSVFITLPSAIPTEDWTGYNEIVITTWDSTLISDILTCCFLYQNGAVNKITATKTNETGAYTSRRYFCNTLDSKELPWKVTLMDTRVNACTNKLKFTEIFYPVQEQGKFAICTKTVYGKLDPIRLIEWFEYQRMMGIDRIITFYGNNFFDTESRKVFSHYEKEGLLLTFNIGTPPQTTKGMEKIQATYKEIPWSLNDENVATFNCYYKMIGYDLASILDFDEFIVMRENVTMKSYFNKNLFNSASFALVVLHVEFFITDWGKSGNHSSLLTRSYLKRTKPLWNTTKYVFVPFRVNASSINTHIALPRKPYKINPNSPIEDTTVHHYRSFSVRLKIYGKLDRFTDYQMERYGPELEARVHEIVAAL